MEMRLKGGRHVLKRENGKYHKTNYSFLHVAEDETQGGSLGLALTTSVVANTLAAPELPWKLGEGKGGESPAASKLFMLEIKG